MPSERSGDALRAEEPVEHLQQVREQEAVPAIWGNCRIWQPPQMSQPAVRATARGGVARGRLDCTHSIISGMDRESWKPCQYSGSQISSEMILSCTIEML